MPCLMRVNIIQVTEQIVRRVMSVYQVNYHLSKKISWPEEALYSMHLNYTQSHNSLKCSRQNKTAVLDCLNPNTLLCEDTKHDLAQTKSSST